MWDITFCASKECYKRKKCFRFIGNHKPASGIPFSIAEFKEKKKKCMFFIDAKGLKRFSSIIRGIKK